MQDDLHIQAKYEECQSMEANQVNKRSQNEGPKKGTAQRSTIVTQEVHRTKSDSCGCTHICKAEIFARDVTVNYLSSLQR